MARILVMKMLTVRTMKGASRALARMVTLEMASHVKVILANHTKILKIYKPDFSFYWGFS